MGKKQTTETAACLQLCSAVPISFCFRCLSGPADGVEEIRGQKAISYPLRPKAEKGLTASPAEPEGLRPQGYTLAVITASAVLMKTKSFLLHSEIQQLFSCPFTPFTLPFHCSNGRLFSFSASAISSRHIFLFKLATLQEADEGSIKVTFSLP